MVNTLRKCFDGCTMRTCLPWACKGSTQSKTTAMPALVMKSLSWKTSSTFGAWEPASRKIDTTQPLKSVRGGAFDSYFDTQAHCQFQSGESPLARKHNIGFRCSLGFCDVILAGEGDEGPEASRETQRNPAPAPAQPEEVLA